MCNNKEAEEEKQEKEKREKEGDASEKCMEAVEISRVAEEGQQMQTSSVEESKLESQEEEEEAVPENLGNLAETVEGKDGLEEVEFGRCTREGEEDRTGETIQINVSREIRHQEVVLLAGSPEPETADLSPSYPGLSLGIDKPHTSQPRRSTSNEETTGLTITPDKDDDGDNETAEQGATGGAEPREEESASDSGEVQKSYWSRHFLVDLLAVAIPVVPTVAWLCRGPVRDGQPMYHIGSLLRGCCTVALHSLRRGGGLRHYPAGGGDLGGSHI